ncbi:MAG TPA: ArsI/CadI family heavy metal resistance metalloenzyme [Pyrinomonadaceae bacterium]|nr:ArsI/CadI family heavy metal resistance metalloenzyme [Pyrinomonadaceae bacterium]
MEQQTERTARALKAHLALNVQSVERSLEFYRRMLGIEPSKVRPGYAKFDVQNPPLNLTLNEATFAERGALSHLGIQLATTEDVLSMRRNWLDAGLDTRDEMATNCCYALQNKTWVRDPDGNEWEAFVVLEDNLPTTSTCCTPEATATTTSTTAEETTTSAAAATCGTTKEAATVEATAAAQEVSSCCATAAPATISR